MSSRGLEETHRLIFNARQFGPAQSLKNIPLSLSAGFGPNENVPQWIGKTALASSILEASAASGGFR